MRKITEEALQRKRAYAREYQRKRRAAGFVDAHPERCGKCGSADWNKWGQCRPCKRAAVDKYQQSPRGQAMLRAKEKARRADPVKRARDNAAALRRFHERGAGLRSFPDRCGCGSTEMDKYGRCRPCLARYGRTYRRTPHGREAVELHERRRQDDPVRSMVRHAQKHARAKGLAITITKADIVIPDRCPVFGTPMVRRAGPNGGASAHSPSIDRYDSSVGYTPENVWIISKRANTIKNDATLDELRLLVAAMERRGKP